MYCSGTFQTLLNQQPSFQLRNVGQVISVPWKRLPARVFTSNGLGAIEAVLTQTSRTANALVRGTPCSAKLLRLVLL